MKKFKLPSRHILAKLSKALKDPHSEVWSVDIPNEKKCCLLDSEVH